MSSDDAVFIRSSGRHFTEAAADGGLVEFRFEPGQECFLAHAPECFRLGKCILPVLPDGRPGHPHFIRIERPELFVVRDGARKMTQNPRRMNADDWADDFANHQDRLKNRLERG